MWYQDTASRSASIKLLRYQIVLGLDNRNIDNRYRYSTFSDNRYRLYISCGS